MWLAHTTGCLKVSSASNTARSASSVVLEASRSFWRTVWAATPSIRLCWYSSSSSPNTLSPDWPV